MNINQRNPYIKAISPIIPNKQKSKSIRTNFLPSIITTSLKNIKQVEEIDYFISSNSTNRLYGKVYAACMGNVKMSPQINFNAHNPIDLSMNKQVLFFPIQIPIPKRSILISYRLIRKKRSLKTSQTSIYF
ncbi:competence protein ComK [Paenibacillus polymyxa]|uniref:competence protein ComK n=2 Tax=Paenibacillus TaxID=44249 RepID=UPI003CC7F736